MIYDLVVVGAGPAGLMAAGTAAAHLKSVLLLEKQADPGRKLLLTGSGQCNFTNICSLDRFLQAYGEHGRFLKPALYHFDNQAAIAFFKKRGLESTVVEETGKVFPSSRRARSVLEVLLAECQQQGVELRAQTAVTEISRPADGAFQVVTERGIVQAHRVLLATGGRSYPATGSTGDGYRWAKTLGHTIVPPHPGLTPFIIRTFPWTDLAGTSFKDLPVTLWRKNKKVKTLWGDWLITHQGLSGPVIQNLARYARAGDTLTLPLVPFEQLEDFRKEWDRLWMSRSNLSLKAWLKQFPLTQGVTRMLMEVAGLHPADTVAQVGREKRALLFTGLTAYPLTIQKLGDFEVAMVTCGGVALDEINAKTMESRIVPGLYFAGEVMDVDGDCGGYDLQAAWSTAVLAVHGMKTKP